MRWFRGRDACEGRAPSFGGALRLGALGAAIAVLVLISLILASIFCAFPWGMKVP